MIQQEVDPAVQLLGVLRSAVEAQCNKYAYTPREKGQKPFHKSEAAIRACFTGNRWGKSFAAAHECNWWCVGRHPYRGTPELPVRVRVLGDGYEYGVEKILLPIFKKIVDPRDLLGGSWEKAYSQKYHTLTYNTKSTIEFMSYKLADLGRGAQMFAGVSLDLLWPDEHCPEDVWIENTARVGDRPLSVIYTLTPKLGKTWEHEILFEPWMDGRGASLGIECFTGSIYENELLDKGSVDRFLMMIKDPSMRQVCETGEWIDLGGEVYPMWNPAFHYVPFDGERVRLATKTVVIDPHPSKPEAYLWCGVDGGGMFAYREYKHQGTVQEGAEEIRRLSAEGGEDIRRFLIDPHWGWKDKETNQSKAKLYIDNGIPVKPAWSGHDVDLISSMSEALSVSPTTQRARFEVMRTCPELKYEIEHNHYKTQTNSMEEGDRWVRVKAHDDLLICAEYFVKSKPYHLGLGDTQLHDYVFHLPRRVRDPITGCIIG